MKRYLLTIALIATATLASISAYADGTNTPPPPPAATLEQRVASLEAYISNGDPIAPLKDTNGVIATSPIVSSLVNSTGGTSPYPGPGHNAWLLASTALVLFMTLPGLALFYGGMVRRKNVLSVLAQCFLITGLVTILWVFVGYGMIFGGTNNPGKEDLISGWVGSPAICWMLNNVTSAPNPNYSYWVSENVVAMFQLMFAIIRGGAKRGTAAREFFRWDRFPETRA